MREAIYYKAQSGIWAISYDDHSSQIDYYSSDQNNNTLTVSGQLALTNYGASPVTFGIKVSDDTEPREGPFPQEIVLTQENGPKDAEQFTLAPGERRSIDVHTALLTEANFRGVSGELVGPDLVLFTGSETRIVGRNR